MFQPSWVTEQCLKWDAFDCCGDADLLPFKCAGCQRLLVLCYECETLYCDLTDLTQRRFPNLDNYSCPQCDVEFGDIFRAESHRSTFADWRAANLDHLIAIPDHDDFVKMLTHSAAQLADYLSRGMRSTAKTRLSEYRNLAESLIDGFAAFRQRGFEIADCSTLQESMQWHQTLADPIRQAYGLLGITDRLFPAVDGNGRLT